MVAVYLAAAVLLASCGSGDGQDEEFMDYDGMKAEYVEKIDSYPFPLPEGVTFPEEPRRPAEPTVYQRGNGIVAADAYWRCAWMDEWLRTREQEPERAAKAMAWLERAVETEFMRRYLEPPGAEVWADEVLGKAKLGDLTIFRDFYLPCPGLLAQGARPESR